MSYSLQNMSVDNIASNRSNRLSNVYYVLRSVGLSLPGFFHHSMNWKTLHEQPLRRVTWPCKVPYDAEDPDEPSKGELVSLKPVNISCETIGLEILSLTDNNSFMETYNSSALVPCQNSKFSILLHSSFAKLIALSHQFKDLLN